MSDFDSLARSAADGNKEDFFNLLTLVIKPQLDLLNTATGNNMLAPTNSPQKPYSPPPPQAKLSAVGANGVFTFSVVLAPQSVSAQIWNEFSYSPVKGFSSQTTTLPPTTATSITVPAPGQTMFVRVRQSYDKANWNSYVLAQTTAVEAGLQSSAATSAAVAFNQSNYATVDTDPSTPTSVRVYGTSGPLTMWVGVKGTKQTIYPSATIVNVSAGTRPVVGWDGEQYLVKNTLPEVFADEIVPVGAVGVPAGGSVTLPVIVPVIGSGGVIGYNVTSGGANITADLNISVTGDGTGATAGPQTIVGGALISVGPGNPGTGFTHATAAASGGVAPGQSGGGTILGTNAGRLVYTQ